MEPIDEYQCVGGGKEVVCQDPQIFLLHHTGCLQINPILVKDNGCNIEEVAPSMTV
jgi:hypothetical protein